MLEVKNLKKVYDGNIQAVAGIDFTIKKGVCFGLLGPNGAGKSTTIEIMEGIKKATSGEILYKGQAVTEDFKKHIGIQFQNTVLQDFMTVREALQMFASFYPDARKINEIAKMCFLEEFLDQYTNRISGGQRQRLLVGIALIHNPEIVFLDEPTTGLDPQSRRNFWELVRTIKAEGKTIVLTTHYMDEAYQLCDEIVIVDQGKVIARGNPKKLLEEHYKGAHISLPQSEKDKVEARYPIQLMEDRVQFHVSDVTESLKELMALNVNLDQVEIQKQSLEDLFVDITGKQLRE